MVLKTFQKGRLSPLQPMKSQVHENDYYFESWLKSFFESSQNVPFQMFYLTISLKKLNIGHVIFSRTFWKSWFEKIIVSQIRTNIIQLIQSLAFQTILIESWTSKIILDKAFYSLKIGQTDKIGVERRLPLSSIKRF